MESQGFVCLNVSMPGIGVFLGIQIFLTFEAARRCHTRRPVGGNHVFSVWSTMQRTRINIWLNDASILRRHVPTTQDVQLYGGGVTACFTQINIILLQMFYLSYTLCDLF